MKKFSSAAPFALAWFLFAAAPLAAQTIISDTFTGSGNITAHAPNINLPGGTYGSFGSNVNGTLSSNMVTVGADQGTATSIMSGGSYTEPTTMTISAGLEEGTTSAGGLNTDRGVGVGFFVTNASGALPSNTNAFNNFTGLVLGYSPNNAADPAIAFVNNVDKANNMQHVVQVVAWPGTGTASATNLGAFSKTTTYTVSFTVNTSASNVGMSNVSVTDPATGFTDTADFAALDNIAGTNVFTTGAGGVMSYSGFMASSGVGGTTGFVSNFSLAAPTVPPSIWTGAATAAWADSGSWSGGVPGATTGTTSTATAEFNADNPSNPTPTIDAGRNLQNITFDNTGGNLTTTLTLGTTGGASLLLTAGGAIQVNSNVVTPQVVNAPLQLEGNYSFTNLGTASLNFGGAIMPDPTLASSIKLTLSGSNANTNSNAINGVLSDSGSTPQLGLTVSGGSWVLGAANTYSGATAVSGGTLTIGNGTSGSLNAASAITVSSGSLVVTAGGSLSTNTIGISSTGSMSVNSGGSVGAAGFTISGGLMTVNSGGAIGAASVSMSAGSLLLASGATIGNVGISMTGGTLKAQPGSGTLAAGSSGTGPAGASLSIGSGATFSMVDGAIGTFNLQQQSTFPGPGLTLNGGTLNFEMGSTGADELVVGAAQASVSGTNTIGVTGIGATLGAGPYTLISAPNGGLSGTFQFPGGATTAYASAGTNLYQLTLNSTNNAVTVSAAPVSSFVIVLDTFNVSTNTQFVSHVPDINLPNPTGTYSLQGSGAIFTLGGTNPDSYVHPGGFASVGGDLGAGVPISSNGSYTKPTTMTISAGLQSNSIENDSDKWRGVGLGFYSQMVNAPTGQDGYLNFQGIVLDPSGNIDLVQTGAANPKSAPAEQVAWPTATLGAFSTSAYYTISYTINTTAATGGISNVSVSNGTVTDSMDFTAIDSYSGSNFFTNANTQYAGFTGSSGNFPGNGLVQNFLLVAGSASGGSYWTGTAGDSTWATAGNWSGAVPGSTTGTTNMDTALFNQTVTSSPTIIDVGGRNVMNITFDTAAVSAMTIGATNGPTLILTSGGTIQTTSTVPTAQLVNAPLQLEGNYTFTSGATSSTATLSFGGTVMPDSSLTSTPTVLTLSGANSGANTIGGVLSDNGSAQLQVSVSGSGTWVYSGAANTYSGGTIIASGATLQLAGSVSTMSQTMNIANSGTLLVASSTTQVVGTILGTGSVTVSSGSLTAYQIRQNSLTIGSGALVTLAASGSGSTTNPTGPNNINFSSNVTSLNIAGTLGAWTGTLDIGNNGLVIAYGTLANDPYATISNMIESGYNGGVWGGTGINSTLAQAGVTNHISTPLNIGLVDFTPGTGNYSNTTFISFEGQTVTTNAILVRMTYMDDLVLAGDMGSNNATSDALLFAANYGTGTTWGVGDLVHDGGPINSSDALLFAANYVVGLPSLDGSTGNDVALRGVAAVPEPASLALAAAGMMGLGLLARRWRGK